MNNQSLLPYVLAVHIIKIRNLGKDIEIEDQMWRNGKRFFLYQFKLYSVGSFLLV